MSDVKLVDAMDPNKNNSPVTVPSEEESTVMLDTAKNTCQWNDQAFNDGDRVCSEGAVYECSFGKWAKTKDAC